MPSVVAFACAFLFGAVEVECPIGSWLVFVAAAAAGVGGSFTRALELDGGGAPLLAGFAAEADAAWRPVGWAEGDGAAARCESDVARVSSVVADCLVSVLAWWFGCCGWSGRWWTTGLPGSLMRTLPRAAEGGTSDEVLSLQLQAHLARTSLRGSTSCRLRQCRRSERAEGERTRNVDERQTNEPTRQTTAIGHTHRHTPSENNIGVINRTHCSSQDPRDKGSRERTRKAFVSRKVGEGVCRCVCPFAVV